MQGAKINSIRISIWSCDLKKTYLKTSDGSP